MPKNKSSEAIYVRLPDELREWLDAQCQREDRNLSNMIRVLIAEAKAARERS